MTPEQMARLFHDTYERLAPDFGYETRPDTKAFDPTSPNGRLMMAVCAEVTEDEQQAAQLRDLLSRFSKMRAEDGETVIRANIRAEQAEAENARLRARLDAAAPHICPNCGPHAKIDEDGCCVSCGADTALYVGPMGRPRADGGDAMTNRDLLLYLAEAQADAADAKARFAVEDARTTLQARVIRERDAELAALREALAAIAEGPLEELYEARNIARDALARTDTP